ncbi:MAG: GNAT family N-acetyltransferase [Cytophagales bacterium]|nr:MAG: GNAT family N-acetyltransferase [Cytophagales bacterium]
MKKLNKDLLQIREATIEDAHFLAEFGKNTFLEAYSYDENEENTALHLLQNFNPERIETEIRGGNVIFLIAELELKPIGYAKLIKYLKPQFNLPYEGDYMEINKVYIQKEYIGCGVGQELIGNIIQRAEKEHIEVLWLVVWADNAKAISFYKKFRFSIQGFHPFQFGKETFQDLLMTKKL